MGRFTGQIHMAKAQIIDGKAIAAKLRTALVAKIRHRVAEGLRPPSLAVILAGDDPASAIYVRNKREACREAGITSLYHPLPASVQEKQLVELINALNEDETVDGILLQLPLPEHINPDAMLELIVPHKDVDGFHPYNLGRLAQKRPALRPCTPYGVMKLLEHTGEPFKNRHAVVVGASNIVGRPMALELLTAGATITVCHRFTTDIASHVRMADILVSAVGKPSIIRGEWIRPGATVIDVGMSRLADGSLAGDVEFAAAAERAAWITPVPGGVGPMTVAMLLENTLMAASWRHALRW